LKDVADGEETKVCSKCGRRLPLMAFYAHKRGIMGRRPDCKRCHNSYRNGWARRRYVPKTGRRYFTRADRAALAAQEGRSL
jgi:hypothetical protein